MSTWGSSISKEYASSERGVRKASSVSTVRQLDGKEAASARPALYSDLPAVGLNDALDDSHAQATPLGAGVLPPVEPPKDVGLIFGINPTAGIPHPQSHSVTPPFRANLHLSASRGELEGVIEQIRQPQLDPRTVAAQFQREHGRPDRKADAFLLHQGWWCSTPGTVRCCSARNAS